MLNLKLIIMNIAWTVTYKDAIAYSFDAELVIKHQVFMGQPYLVAVCIDGINAVRTMRIFR